jgi:hypothetical protein
MPTDCRNETVHITELFSIYDTENIFHWGGGGGIRAVPFLASKFMVILTPNCVFTRRQFLYVNEKSVVLLRTALVSWTLIII